MLNTKRGTYFENLDGLRFIAFFLVFLRHYFDFSSYKPSSGAENLLLENFAMNGRLGVNLFFVLSGFLITFLLLKELEGTGKIHVKFFYVRRILRIWPLYFLVVGLNYFVIPLLTHQFSVTAVKEHLIYNLFFISNFDILNTGFVGVGNDGLGILWSIAVEEQFYLVWPVLCLLIHKKYYNYLFSGLIVLCVIFRYVYVDNIYVLYFHTLSVMSDLCIGALLAYNILYNQTFREYIVAVNKRTIISVYLLLLLAIVFHNNWAQINTFTKVSERLLMALLFAFVIAEQCFSVNSVFKLGTFKLISKLGIISYGLYCLHLLSITIVQKLNIVFHVDQGRSLVFYSELLLALFFTIIMSYLSYKYFEKFFLAFKRRYSIAVT